METVASGLWSAPRTIRVAGPELTHAALSLLPELLGSEALPSRIWVASAGDRPSCLQGAATFIPVLRNTTHPGFRCLVRVLPEYRRQGIGRALIGALHAEAQRWNLPYLHAWQPVDAHGAEAAVLRTLGFRTLSLMHHFVGSTERSLQASARLEASLRARRREQGGVEVVPLHTVPRDQVVSLYQRQLGGSSEAIGQHIGHLLQDEGARAISVAAWDGQRVQGFLLLSLSSGVPQADFWVSEPDQRNGWVAALMLHESLRRLAEAGFTQHRFHCNEHVRATMNFARRSGADCVAVQHCVGIDINASAAS
jgi:GNAT superfamily N-acetyltransferase